MAQYFTDFSEYPTGLAPSDFSERWGAAGVPLTVKDEAGATGGKYLEVDSSSVKAATLIAWDILDSDPDTADIELLTRYRSSGFQFDTVGLALRGSGNSAATATADLLYIWDGSKGKHSLYNDGTYSNKNPYITISVAPDTWVNQRSRATGTQLQSKFWLGELADEPLDWQVTGYSTFGAGFAGLYPYRDFVFGYDMLSVGTNGDTAPSEAVGGGGAVAPSNAPVIATPNPGETSVSADFTFSEASNTGDTVTGYEVRVDGGPWESLGVPSPLSFTIMELTASTTYSLEMRALNTGGVGPVSSAQTFTTTAPAAAAPSNAPEILSSINVTKNTVTGNFTFDDGANTGSSPTGFEVRVNGGTWKDLGNPSPKSFTVSGLTEGTTYNSPGVELRAYNATGSSPVSSPKIFTTSVSAPSVPAPRNLSTSEITENSALLTWEKGV